MIPSVRQDTASVASKAATIRWTVLEGKYETEKACTQALSGHEELNKSGYSRAEQDRAKLLSEAQCIDENDPRFKGWKGAYVGLIR